jgi:hypothetical protein
MSPRARTAVFAAVAGLAALAALPAAGARAATPLPDVASMTLTRDDLPPGAHVVHRGPLLGSGVVAGSRSSRATPRAGGPAAPRRCERPAAL